jgi:hypothetical protein
MLLLHGWLSWGNGQWLHEDRNPCIGHHRMYIFISAVSLFAIMQQSWTWCLYPKKGVHAFALQLALVQ